MRLLLTSPCVLSFANYECIFVSRSIALYGLLVFYGLVSEELKGRRPLAKFLAIKLIVMATFYQSFAFKFLSGRVIKPTQFWTATNIANGLNALAICIEVSYPHALAGGNGADEEGVDGVFQFVHVVGVFPR